MMMITFLEEIDGEPADTAQNQVTLERLQAKAGHELGPAGPQFFMPPAALLAVDGLARKHSTKTAPAFTVIVNGRLTLRDIAA